MFPPDVCTHFARVLPERCGVDVLVVNKLDTEKTMTPSRFPENTSWKIMLTIIVNAMIFF